MNKNVLTIAMTAILLLPLGCRNNYRLGMEPGPWGLPMVKVQKTSRIPSNIDPFIHRDELKPPQTFQPNYEVKATRPRLQNATKVQQTGFKTNDPSVNPF